HVKHLFTILSQLIVYWFASLFYIKNNRVGELFCSPTRFIVHPKKNGLYYLVLVISERKHQHLLIYIQTGELS
ncbi:MULTISPECIES: hypothetical protein, partial [unclassified Granulicatella]|uniref:hypothetical protein n=1 Tax=unclassified Granulicatella TaxID=2630493 RepID=UPI001ADDCEF4